MSFHLIHNNVHSTFITTEKMSILNPLLPRTVYALYDKLCDKANCISFSYQLYNIETTYGNCLSYLAGNKN